MRRRSYLAAVAAVLGAAGASEVAVAADDDRYRSVIERFADVTRFRAPESGGTGRAFVRLYDAAADTLVYGTTSHGGDAVTVATRDATGLDLAG
jgi:hypothetical protein